MISQRVLPMPYPASVLQAETLSFHYPNHPDPVLCGISASFAPAQFTGLLGPNGTGKSTLLRLLAGLLQPSRGSVKLGDAPLSSFSRRSLAKRLAFVPQDVRLNLPFTCREVVAMGRFAHKSSWQLFGNSKHDDVVERCLEETATAHLAERKITEVSGGEAQRVRIAQALAQESDIILLDEPTAHLDIKHQVAVMELALRLRQRGMTVIAALHDLDFAAVYCDRLILLHNHTVFQDGSPAQVVNAENLRSVFDIHAEVVRDEDERVRVRLRRNC